MFVGGELYDRVVEKTLSEEGHFSEYDAARITRNILEAIHYCHMHGIAHRGKFEKLETADLDFSSSAYKN
jgi:serine/threonine protein kinase